jgi:hypothetical protein
MTFRNSTQHSHREVLFDFFFLDLFLLSKPLGEVEFELLEEEFSEFALISLLFVTEVEFKSFFFDLTELNLLNGLCSVGMNSSSTGSFSISDFSNLSFKFCKNTFIWMK